MHRAVAALAVILALPLTALAWNDYGHQLAAAIAYADLTPEAKARTAAILKAHPQYEALALKCPKGMDIDQYVFMRACTWPDMVRGKANPLHETDHHAEWHYINIPIDLDGIKGPTPPTEYVTGAKPANAVLALGQCDIELKDTKRADADQGKTLCWLLHLGSDLHQPLHAVSLFSPQFPQGDRGGNSFFVSESGKPINLHAYWDKGLGTEGGDSNAVAARARKLRERPEFTREALKADLPKTAYLDWANESAAIARTTVYKDGQLKGAKSGKNPEQTGEPVPPIPEGYKADCEKVSEKRIVLAGYRLADQINGLVARPR